MLVDSNLLIYSVQPPFSSLRDWLAHSAVYYSAVSRLEILGYHRLTPIAKQAIEQVLQPIPLILPTALTFEIAITLRQQRKMSLGDALIAATCLEHQLTLATHNVKDFEWIAELNLYDPLL